MPNSQIFNTLKSYIENDKLKELKQELNKLEDKDHLDEFYDQKEGGSLLHWACYYNKPEFVKLLASKYKKYPPKDNNDKYPWEWAAKNEATEAFVEICNNFSGRAKRDLKVQAEVVKERLEQYAYGEKYGKFFVEPVLEAPDRVYPSHCGLEHLRTKTVLLPTDETERTPTMYEEVHAELCRTSRKTGQVKSRFNIGSIHHQQRVTVNHQNTTQGNTVVVDFSFSIKAILPDETEKEFFITFPLDIPRFNRNEDAKKSEADCYNFSSTQLEEKEKLKILEALYKRGREVRGADDEIKHGSTPKYDSSRGDAQFIRHTEQTLAVYLCQPEAVGMITQRLISEIRSKFPNIDPGSTLKIYHMGLHLHSDKTPCGPCEYTLLGLQNTWRPYGNAAAKAKRIKGFSELFEDALLKKNKEYAAKIPGAYFNFSFPGKDKPKKADEARGVRLFTTFTSDYMDHTHQSHPVAKTPLTEDIAPTHIETRTRASAKNLWTVNFGGALPNKVLKTTSPDTSQRTTFLSGSSKTAATKKSVSKIGEIKAEELLEIKTHLLAYLDIFYIKKSDGKTFKFKRDEISPYDAKGRADSCGFNALETTREDFLTVIKKGLNKKEVAGYLLEHIVSVWRQHKLQPGNSALINYLNGRADFKRWYDRAGTYKTVDEKLHKLFPKSALAECLKSEIIDDELGLSANLIRAWSFASNNEVRIFELFGGEDSQRVRWRLSPAPEKPNKVFRVLFSENHFDRLNYSAELTLQHAQQQAQENKQISAPKP